MANETKLHVSINSADYDSLINLMDHHEEYPMMLFGENEDGEDVHVSINKDNIIVETLQSNHWVRKNVYWRDFTQEELYPERW